MDTLRAIWGSSLEITSYGLQVLYWLFWGWVVMCHVAFILEDRLASTETIVNMLNVWTVVGFWYWVFAVLRYEPDLMFMFKVSLFSLWIPVVMNWGISMGFFPAFLRGFENWIFGFVRRWRERRLEETLERNYRATAERHSAPNSIRLEQQARTALPAPPERSRGRWSRMFNIIIGSIPVFWNDYLLEILFTGTRMMFTCFLLGFIPALLSLWLKFVSSNPLDLLMFAYFLLLYIVVIIWLRACIWRERNAREH